MPYIKQADRRKFDALLFEAEKLPALGIGELNYLFSMLAASNLKKKGVSYTSLAETRAALTDCAEELYRRLAAPYEDAKADENGDVFAGVLPKAAGE